MHQALRASDPLDSKPHTAPAAVSARVINPKTMHFAFPGSEGRLSMGPTHWTQAIAVRMLSRANSRRAHSTRANATPRIPHSANAPNSHGYGLENNSDGPPSCRTLEIAAAAVAI